MSAYLVRMVRVNGRRTSMKLEPEMLTALNEAASREGVHPDEMVARFVKARPGYNYTSAVRAGLVEIWRLAVVRTENMSVV